jgi:hypothetical protein
MTAASVIIMIMMSVTSMAAVYRHKHGETAARREQHNPDYQQSQCFHGFFSPFFMYNVCRVSEQD